MLGPQFYPGLPEEESSLFPTPLLQEWARITIMPPLLYPLPARSCIFDFYSRYFTRFIEISDY
jgi:hypothetical protein